MTSTGNSNELTLNMVKRKVYSWSIRHREAGYTNEQLARISQEYFEDLLSEGVTAGQFEAASGEVRKRCRFFPKMVDILEAASRVNGIARKAVSGLIDEKPFVMTEEDAAIGQRNLKIIGRMMKREITEEQALSMVTLTIGTAPS